MATFNGIDYAIFVLLFLSVAVGMARGFVKEVISLLAWAAAFVVSTLYAVKFATVLPGSPPAPPGVDPLEAVSMVSIVVSYLVLFVGVLICGSILKVIANYMVEGSGLSLINRFLGALFGFARGSLIVLLAMFFVAFTAFSTHALWKDSKLVAVFHPGVKWLNHMAQPYLADIQAKMKKTAKSLHEEDLSDVIKAKPVKTTPAATPVPAQAAPQPTPASEATAPATPVKVPAEIPVAPTPAAPAAPVPVGPDSPSAPVPTAPAPATDAAPQTAPKTP
jgi:membrane protein required for colicin V production